VSDSPWCDCMSKGTWKKQDGWTLDIASGMQVHSTCRRPSRLNYMKQQNITKVEDSVFHEGKARKVVDIDWGPTVEEEWSWE
jgi:hypothetical protein